MRTASSIGLGSSSRSSSCNSDDSSSTSLLSLTLSLLATSTLIGNANAVSNPSPSNRHGRFQSTRDPPSFLNQLDPSSSSSSYSSSPIQLNPPSILNPQVDPNHHILSDLSRRGVALDANSQIRKRAQSTSRTSQSSQNHDDKSQMLGQMGNAYNVALNVSSSPGQRTFVELDTGSADLWVISSTCDSKSCDSQGLSKFDPNQSQTFKNVSITQSSSATSSTNVSVSSNSSSQVSNPNNPLGQSLKRDLAEETSDFKIDFSSHSFKPISTKVSTDISNTSIPFSITYGSTESATGILGSDDLTLSGLTFSNQIFGLVNYTNLTLGNQGISGVLGLGFPRGSSICRNLISFSKEELNDSNPNPFVSNLLINNNVSYPIFSLNLERGGGTLTLGALDPEVLTDRDQIGQVQWNDVVPFPSGNTASSQDSNSTGSSSSSSSSNTTASLTNLEGTELGPYIYWSLPLTSLGYNATPISITPTYPSISNQIGSNSTIAILDSGTIGIIGSFRDVENLYSQIPESRHVGEGVWYVPCDTNQRMFFQFGDGRNFTMGPEDYIIGPAAGNPYACISWPIAAAGTPDGVDWIFGQTFLRTVYSIFSFGISGKESPKIGLYPLRQPADTNTYSGVFIPTSPETLSSFLANEASTIATILPNSLVSVPYPSTTSSYQFANATVTPTLGTYPTIAAGNSTIRNLISMKSGNVDLPTIANSSDPLPAPSNPAQDVQKDSQVKLRENLVISCLFSSVVVGSFFLL